jgi:hypothetical protein
MQGAIFVEMTELLAVVALEIGARRVRALADLVVWVGAVDAADNDVAASAGSSTSTTVAARRGCNRRLVLGQEHRLDLASGSRIVAGELPQEGSGLPILLFPVAVALTLSVAGTLAGALLFGILAIAILKTGTLLAPRLGSSRGSLRGSSKLATKLLGDKLTDAGNRGSLSRS